MEPAQPLQDDICVTNYQRAAGRDGFSPDHVVSSVRADIIGLPPPMPSHPPGLSPSPGLSSLYAPSPTRNEATTLESSPFFPTLPTTPHYPNYLPTGVQNQGHILGHRQDLFNGPPPRSNSLFGPPQGFHYPMTTPHEAERNFNTRVFEYQRSNLEQAAFRSPAPSPPLNGSESGWAGAQDAAPSFGNRPFPSGGEHQGRLQIVNEPGRVVPRSFNANSHGMDSYSAADRTASASGRPLLGMRGHRYEPYADARSLRRQAQSPGPSASLPPGEGKFDLPEHPTPFHPHSLSDEGVGNEAYFEAVLPNHPSVMAGPSGSTAGATETANHIQNTPDGERKPRKKRNEFKAFLATLPANSSGRGPTSLLLVPQTRYKCPNTQERWSECAPIEFGSVRLTDAANEAYPGLQGANDKVLDYKGVGSAITCRLTFAGRNIGTSKILTTNSKTPREHITKRKLAFEVSMFVWDCIGEIQNQPGCADLAFRDLVLVRLVRVAKASWQPVLCYEAPIPTSRSPQDVPRDSFA